MAEVLVFRGTGSAAEVLWPRGATLDEEAPDEESVNAE